MFFRAVGRRCAVHIDSWNLPISSDRAIAILAKKGFAVVDVDLPSLARSFVGRAAYRRGARLSEAPAVFDCSSFVKWLYAQRGVWIPRRSIQQITSGFPAASSDLLPGDLVFRAGWINYYENDPAHGVGHVGIAVSRDRVVHAANKKLGAVESEAVTFLKPESFRGIRRILPHPSYILTLETPLDREIETSDDVRWVVLQNFS